MSLLGVDIGTSALKAVVFDAETGRPIADHRVDYAMASARPGEAELDPEIVWAAFVTATRAVANHIAVRRDPVRAVSWSSSGDEMVLVDGGDRPLGPVILSADTRGADQLAELSRRVDGPDLARRTGMSPYPAHPLVRLLWYRAAQPDVLAVARRALGWAEWLQLRLGLEPVADDTSASRWMVFDLVERCWAWDVMDRLDLPGALLPRTAAPGVLIGEIPDVAAGELGLRGTVQAVTGAFDQVAATLGSGAWRTGDAAVGTGTWEVLTAPIDAAGTPGIGSQHGIEIGAFAGPTPWAAFALNPGGGSLLSWFANLVARPGSASVSVNHDLAQMIDALPDEPGDLTVLPHFQGSPSPVPDPAARGAIAGLTLATTRSDVLRGLLEGITFQLRANLEAIGQIVVVPDRIRNSGGGSRSPVWVQLKADVLGVPVETVAVTETGCLAAALLAGVATGIYSRLSDPLDAFVQVDRRYEPRREMRDRYDESYEQFRRLAPDVAPILQGGKSQ